LAVPADAEAGREAHPGGGRVGVVVLVALVALAAGSLQRQEEPNAQVRAPSTTPAPSTTADRRGFRPLAGVPLAGPTRLRLLVASDPRPVVVDLDQDSVQPVTGLPTGGERVVSVLPVGEHAPVVHTSSQHQRSSPVKEVASFAEDDVVWGREVARGAVSGKSLAPGR
jgi:hypothetical protein